MGNSTIREVLQINNCTKRTTITVSDPGQSSRTLNLLLLPTVHLVNRQRKKKTNQVLGTFNFSLHTSLPLPALTLPWIMTELLPN